MVKKFLIFSMGISLCFAASAAGLGYDPFRKPSPTSPGSTTIKPSPVTAPAPTPTAQPAKPASPTLPPTAKPEQQTKK